MTYRRLLLSFILTLGMASRASAQTSIIDTPHNLSSSGPGPVRAINEDRICIFCHTPHGSRVTAPLWNREDSNASYIPYNSPTLQARPGQPTGSSKLCLSCHDGTVGLGDLVSESSPVEISGLPVIGSGGSNIGTDLRDDHPISFPYADALSGGSTDLAAPHTWDESIRLDPDGMLQCTTCHDPHNNEWGQFLVTTISEARLCRECHTLNEFNETAHAESTNSWNGTGTDPWPHTEMEDVADNACFNCHQSHHAPGAEELLTSERDEDVCFVCHNGSVADRDLTASFQKPWRHPVRETSGGHVPGEDPRGLPDHVTCVDCHNPHEAVDEVAEPPFVPGLLRGVSGTSISGMPVEEALYEYEVCLKCHAEESGQTITGITRQIASDSIRREFSTDSPSFHPVVISGRNVDVPSLIQPLTPESLIYCSECHGDNAPNTGFDDSPQGTHGSIYRYLLKKDYQTADGTSESMNAYALCYSCHDRSSILADESFSAHRRHIVEERTSCSVCHDPHGIDNLQGNSANNAHLINFDISVVEPLPGTGELEYRSLGMEAGSCTLRCHETDHDSLEY